MGTRVSEPASQPAKLAFCFLVAKVQGHKRVVRGF